MSNQLKINEYLSFMNLTDSEYETLSKAICDFGAQSIYIKRVVGKPTYTLQKISFSNSRQQKTVTYQKGNKQLKITAHPNWFEAFNLTND